MVQLIEVDNEHYAIALVRVEGIASPLRVETSVFIVVLERLFKNSRLTGSIPSLYLFSVRVEGIEPSTSMLSA